MNAAMVYFAGLPSADVAIGKFNVLEDPFSKATGIDVWYQRAYAGEIVETPEFAIDMGIATEDWGTVSKPVQFKMTLVPDVRDDGRVSRVFAIMFEVLQHHVVRDIGERLIGVNTRAKAASAAVGGLLGKSEIFAVRIWQTGEDGHPVVIDGARKENKTFAPWRDTPETVPDRVLRLAGEMDGMRSVVTRMNPSDSGEGEV